MKVGVVNFAPLYCICFTKIPFWHLKSGKKYLRKIGNSFLTILFGMKRWSTVAKWAVFPELYHGNRRIEENRIFWSLSSVFTLRKGGLCWVLDGIHSAKLMRFSPSNTAGGDTCPMAICRVFFSLVCRVNYLPRFFLLIFPCATSLRSVFVATLGK